MNTSLGLFVLIVILNILDTITTHMGLNNGARELNPIMNWFIQQFGTFGIIGWKVVILSILGILVQKNYIGDNSLKLMVLIFFIVVLNNLYMLYFR